MRVAFRIISFLISWFIAVNNVNSQWMTVLTPTRTNLNSISICEDGSGWIVGDNGTMLYKQGSNWTMAETVTEANLFSVFMISETNGWAVGSRGTILHYDGIKWSIAQNPGREGLFSVSFKDPFNGVAVGLHGTVMRFNQGVWQPAGKIGKDNLYCAEYKDDLLLIGGGTEAGTVPIIKRRERSGRIKTEEFDPGYTFIKDIVCLSPENIWAVGLFGIIFHYNGKKWIRIIANERIPSLSSICFSDENHGVAVGYRGAAMIYSDGTWKREDLPVKVKLNGVAVSGDQYYAVGNGGAILTFEKKPGTLPNEQNLALNHIKLRNYPNPVADVLNYVIPEEFNGTTGRVTISNSEGQILFNNNLHDMKAGQEHQISTSTLNNGIYFILMESAGRSGTGKFVICR